MFPVRYREFLRDLVGVTELSKQIRISWQFLDSESMGRISNYSPQMVLARMNSTRFNIIDYRGQVKINRTCLLSATSPPITAQKVPHISVNFSMNGDLHLEKNSPWAYQLA